MSSAKGEVVIEVARHSAWPELDLPLPRYMTEGSAGMDVCAALSSSVELHPGRRALIPTGLSLAIPSGFEVQVRPRSGLAFRHGVTVLNSPGTIDSDYRGEVKVLLINHGHEVYSISPGERIAQLVVAATVRATLREVDALPLSERGEGGFGHTGRS